MMSLLAAPSVRDAALVFLLGEGEDPGGPRDTHFDTPSARVTARSKNHMGNQALILPHDSSQSHQLVSLTPLHTAICSHERAVNVVPISDAAMSDMHCHVSVVCRDAFNVKMELRKRTVHGFHRRVTHAVKQIRHHTKGQQHLRLTQHSCAHMLPVVMRHSPKVLHTLSSKDPETRLVL